MHGLHLRCGLRAGIWYYLIDKARERCFAQRTGFYKKQQTSTGFLQCVVAQFVWFFQDLWCKWALLTACQKKGRQ